jgi:hypothetical protein
MVSVGNRDAFLQVYEMVARCSEVVTLVRLVCDQECLFTALLGVGLGGHSAKKVLPVDIILIKSKIIML